MWYATHRWLIKFLQRLPIMCSYYDVNLFTHHNYARARAITRIYQSMYVNVCKTMNVRCSCVIACIIVTHEHIVVMFAAFCVGIYPIKWAVTNFDSINITYTLLRLCTCTNICGSPCILLVLTWIKLACCEKY